MAIEPTLPQDVIDLDRRLEREAVAAIAGLAELRWRYTLGPEGPRSFKDYAGAVGCDPSAVRFMARGYERWLEEVGAGGQDISINDCVQLMYVAPKDRPAVLEIAAERGVSVGYARSLLRRKQGAPTGEPPSNSLSIPVPDWLGELLDQGPNRVITMPASVEEAAQRLIELAYELNVMQGVKAMMEAWLAVSIARPDEDDNESE